MPPAAYVDQANTGADDLVTSRSVTKPSGVASGDYGVFWLARWDGGSSFPAVTAPSGAVLRSTVTGTQLETLCYLLKISGETSFAFSWTGTRWTTLCGVFFTGVDPALDLSTVPVNSASGSTSAISTTTVTTVVDAALAWHVNNISGASGFTHTPPTDFTETADIAQWSAAYRISPGTGSQSAASASMSGSTNWAAGLVALAPAADAGTTANAGTASATGDAQNPSAAVSGPAETAAATGTGQVPAAGLSPLPAAASATGTAADLSVQLAATVEASTATGQAPDVSVSTGSTAQAGPATGTGSAEDALAQAEAVAGLAGVTGTAHEALFIQPQTDARSRVNGREPVSSLSGREPVSQYSGREG
jgi:hypothetical protein